MNLLKNNYMKIYGLYIKNITKEEIIKKVNAVSVDEAVSMFSLIKNLTKENIINIFKVKEILEK